MNSTLSSQTVRGYAKVNLSLSIIGDEVDDFGDRKHLIDTIYYALDLYDDVRLECIRGIPFDVTIECQSAGEYQIRKHNVPLNGENLVSIAIRELLKLLGIEPNFAFRVLITKRIPVSAGLAGGSADAAAALIALRELLKNTFGIIIQDSELFQVARKCGSDVPFVLMASDIKRVDEKRKVVARGTHFGEVLEELLDFPEVQLDIFPQDFGLKASEVYKKWDELQDGVDMDLTKSDQASIGFNALQNAVFALSPELLTTFNNYLTTANEQDECTLLVSGSGPTILRLNMDN
ncbi:MAG: hypothetical protein LBI63_01495 [Candidatus Ancillula sp.]|jgi:4-diphosphocytidyl-2-C-methyl-D-erythritol kinase|nr:hypothetical protein [Candidatus Ancillula sp.]